MSFSNSSVIVVDNLGAVFDFQTNQSSPYEITFPAGSTGIWTWVVSRAGYTCQSGTFDAALGGLVSASPQPEIRLQPNGSTMYEGTTDANLSISFDLTTPGSERCFINIGNATVGIQAIIDEIEGALESQDGCRFLVATNCSECSIAELASGNFLFMGAGYRIRRAAPGDVNATVSAFCISSDGVVVDGINGDVAFISSNLTAAEVGEAVWDSLLASHTVPSSFGSFVKTLALELTSQSIVAEVNANEVKIDSILADTNELQLNQNNWLTATGFSTPADVLASQTAIQSDIAALNDFDPALEQVIVGTNNDKTGYFISGTKTTLDALNDLSSAQVTAAVPSTAQIEAALLNEGDGQQLIDAIVQAIGNVNLDEVALVAAIRADIERTGGMLDSIPNLSEIEASTILAKTSDIAGLNDITAAEVWAAATRTITGGQVDTIAGTIQTLDALDIAQDLQHSATQALINTLNNLSAEQVNAQVDLALTDYDGPTKAELDAVQAAITIAISGLNNVSSAQVAQAVWDYLQSSGTVSGSLKEAVQIILVRSGLIPASI